MAETENTTKTMVINWNQESPYAFIQWQGTEVCADISCTCGARHHFDGLYMFAVKCGCCGKTWAVEPFVRLVEDEDNDPSSVIELNCED